MEPESKELYPTSEKQVDFMGENGNDGDEVRERQVNDGVQGSFVGEGDSSCEVEESSNSICSMINQDPFVESISALQSAHIALEKELLKFKDINKEVSADNLISDLSSNESLHSEMIETANRTKTELEDIFQQKIEAQVEYLALSKTIERLRAAAVNQLPVLQEQKALASNQIRIVHKLGNIQNKAEILEKEAKDLESISDETLKLQNRVCKYTSCFFVQLILLLVVVGVYVFQSPSDFTQVIPT